MRSNESDICQYALLFLNIRTGEKLPFDKKHLDLSN